jgi:hypothetical protein
MGVARESAEQAHGTAADADLLEAEAEAVGQRAVHHRRGGRRSG